MKKFIKAVSDFASGVMAKAAAIGAGIALVLGAQSAHAQLYFFQPAPGPGTARTVEVFTPTNFPVMIPPLTQTSIVTQVKLNFAVTNTGLGFWANYLCTTNAAGGGGLTFVFNPCVNGRAGSIFTTYGDQSVTFPLGSTNVIRWTNFPASLFYLTPWYQLTTITNSSTNTITITNGGWDMGLQ